MTPSYRFGLFARYALVSGAAASGALALNSASAQVVQDRFLSRVQAAEQGNCSTVTVEFNVPVQYQSHFPENGGRDLRIAVQPLNFNRLSIGNGAGAESARPRQVRSRKSSRLRTISATLPVQHSLSSSAGRLAGPSRPTITSHASSYTYRAPTRMAAPSEPARKAQRMAQLWPTLSFQ